MTTIKIERGECGVKATEYEVDGVPRAVQSVFFQWKNADQEPPEKKLVMVLFDGSTLEISLKSPPKQTRLTPH